MNTNIYKISDKNFSEKITEEKKLVLVDFWADWCNPCKVLMPILEEISIKYKEKVIFYKINIDENPNTAPKYSIRGIPTLLLFHKSNLIATKVGSISIFELEEFLNLHIKELSI
ncbi:thioredoxin [Buchnera aphidicola (Kurisakia onigurumii)]|uniref:thioredoxin n=1 Tax=Buchnera aphidicola TaxID=9 RepID=UPI0031B72E97